MTNHAEKLEKEVADIVENLHRELIRHGRMDKDEERWHFENIAKQIVNLTTSEVQSEST